MMRCMICGKPRTTLESTLWVFNPAYCYGACISTYTSNTTVPIFPSGVISLDLTYNGYSFTGMEKPEEEKPLEWTDVEAQLDDFMAELNKGKS